MTEIVAGERPLLFISHKHENRAIANVLRDFLEMNTAGAVEVFQSSSEQASGPRAGFSLNQELKAALWRASAFVLIYTQPELDWSYCMYEYGVANSPNSPDTRMILLRCGDAVPALFAGQVNVNARNREDVEKFVNELLTAPTFFRRRDKAITQHQSKSRAVTAIAENLWQQLQTCIPRSGSRSLEEWPAYPFIQLQLDMVHVEAIRTAPAADRARITTEVMKREGIVSDYDKVAGRLFNSPAFDKGMKFESLVQSWMEKNDKRDSQSRWVESLCRQIADGARWQFPPLIWELMQGIDDDRWYAPIVTRVRRVPEQYLQFDVYFFRFDLDDEQQRAIIGIPPAA
ncbi:MAG TPA: TIR domain-containing protein [Thermoanaerobaculia bacterium]|nr:TIR domain-containing protein [Thermoanaerobaculia bacterium]